MIFLYKDQYELELSTIEKYIQSVKARAPELEEIAGELMNGKLMRIPAHELRMQLSVSMNETPCTYSPSEP